MWVDRPRRGLGITAVCSTRSSSARPDAGAPLIRLYTNRSLDEAKALFRARGYEEIPRYNDDPYANHWFESGCRAEHRARLTARPDAPRRHGAVHAHHAPEASATRGRAGSACRPCGPSGSAGSPAPRPAAASAADQAGAACAGRKPTITTMTVTDPAAISLPHPAYTSSCLQIADRIKSDVATAMKAGERERVGALRLVLSELQKADKDGDADELAVLRRERKRRREAAEAYREAAREDLAEGEDVRGAADRGLPAGRALRRRARRARAPGGGGDRRLVAARHGPGDQARDGGRRRTRRRPHVRPR